MIKNRIKMLMIALVALFTSATTCEKAAAQGMSISFQVFYDNLAPYGQWIYDPEFGNVWVPNEDGGFRPYGSRGHWVMTEYGNTWVSEDPWGWAVYHYGRWTYNPYYGWIWVPGYEWAPAWVSWRLGNSYAGWAPLGPGMQPGMDYYTPDSWWIFTGPYYMYRPNCMQYWYGPSYNYSYIRQTTVVNNYYIDNSTRVRYNWGPRAEVIQQYTRQPVRVYQVSQLNRPGAANIGRSSVSLYRPSVDRGSVSQARPSRVMQAPRPIGRAQSAPKPESGRQPSFRSQSNRDNSGYRDYNGNDNSRGGQVDQSDRYNNSRNDYRGNNSNGRSGQIDQSDRSNSRSDYRDNNSNGRGGQVDQSDRYNSRSDYRGSDNSNSRSGYTQPTQRSNDNVPQTRQPDRYDTRGSQPQTSTPQQGSSRGSWSQPGRSNTAPQQSDRPTPSNPQYDRRMDSRQRSAPQQPNTGRSAPQPAQQQNPGGSMRGRR